MSVHFWISVGDIAWLSCFVVLYNLGCLSLQVWRWKALWNKHSLLIFRLISKVGNFKSFSMLVIEPGSLLKRADLLCTISIFLIWFSWYGSQALLAYSTLGLTITWYTLFFISSENFLIFLLKKPSDLFALANMLLMCVSHLSVLVNWTPKYGFDLHFQTFGRALCSYVGQACSCW